MKKNKGFLYNIIQNLSEWHCILEGHMWYKISKKHKRCARCKKKRRRV